MKFRLGIAAFAVSINPILAQAQQESLGDLEGRQPVVLSGAELQKLLPGAAMSRTTTAGSRQFWSNDPGGTFVASTDNHSKPGRSTPGSAPGTWRIDDKGRYCVTFDWRAGKEDWCRVVIRAGDGYYMARSGKDRTEKLFKVEIGRK